MPNMAKAHDKSQIEQKAKMSALDSTEISNMLEDIYKKGYKVYGEDDIDLVGKKYLFSSSTDTHFSTALADAKKDADIKIKYLGDKGNQLILTNEINGTHTVIIITEIKDKNHISLFNRNTDKYD